MVALLRRLGRALPPISADLVAPLRRLGRAFTADLVALLRRLGRAYRSFPADLVAPSRRLGRATSADLVALLRRLGRASYIRIQNTYQNNTEHHQNAFSEPIPELQKKGFSDF